MSMPEYRLGLVLVTASAVAWSTAGFCGLPPEKRAGFAAIAGLLVALHFRMLRCSAKRTLEHDSRRLAD
jgi:hypothetical protein